MLKGIVIIAIIIFLTFLSSVGFLSIILLGLKILENIINTVDKISRRF